MMWEKRKGMWERSTVAPIRWGTLFSDIREWPLSMRRSALAFLIFWMLFYVICIFIPLAYMWAADLPPPLEKLRVSQGELHYKSRSRIVYLKEASGRHTYTCWPSECYPKNSLKDLAGKQAEVWWFEYTPYPGVRRRNLMRLVVEGQEENTYEKRLKSFISSKELAPYQIATFLVVFLLSQWWCLSVFYDRMVCLRDEKPLDFLEQRKSPTYLKTRRQKWQ
jgi:hypothetical protein